MRIDVLLKMILILAPSLNHEKAIYYATQISIECRAETQTTAIAIISAESDFRENAASLTSDYGLFQLHAPLWGDRYHIINPRENIKVGCSILASLWKRYGVSKTDWAGNFHSRHPYTRQRWLRRVNLKLKEIKNVR